MNFTQKQLSSVTLTIHNPEDTFIPSIREKIKDLITSELKSENKVDDLKGFFKKRFTWGTVSTFADPESSFIQIIVDYLLSALSDNHSIHEKTPPLLSTATGFLKKDVENVPNFRELARKYRREDFARSLGYRNWDDLMMRSVCFFEYQSLNFYFSANKTTGRTLIWGDRFFKIMAEYSSWQECILAMKTAQFNDLVEKEMEKLREKENRMERSMF